MSLCIVEMIMKSFTRKNQTKNNKKKSNIMSYKYEEFLEWPVKQLQSYLAVRGLRKSDRHVELVARAFSAMELQLPILQSEEEQRKELQKNYEDRLSHFGISDPLNYMTESTNDVTKWPPIDPGNIFGCILKRREFDADYIGEYKDQKAYSYFDSW